MKVKELQKTVNVAWSPPAQHPILLAAGTAAQQLDASFNTSASLELYALNLQEPGYDMELKASIASDHRFHKLIWGPHGNNPAGIIVGGCDNGTIKIYSAAKLLANDPNCLISSPHRHTGPVRALDFNPFQVNLLATGATESEIYVWDIVNNNNPMTPGSKSQPYEDVQYIEWNKQVQHILASTFSQRCVIWDLRKNMPIIKLSDANSKVRWKVVQWHPEVATQLCLASEDDQAPVIQLWDLRFATSPLKTFQNHQRGVLSIAWNPHDPDLLLSCAKDNRVLCWNPNSDVPNGEVLCELTQTNQWNFDVSWCPRHPGLVVGTSFDGHAAIYSLLGGQQQVSTETADKIVDSFPGMDPFTQAPPPVRTESAVVLTKAPKWLKRPFGASFGFGGKLAIFENEPVDPNLPTSSGRKVIISQVVTQPDLIQRSNELEDTLAAEDYTNYCRGKAEKASDEHAKKIWNCVGAYFSENPTKNILELLGYDVETVNNKLNEMVPSEDIDDVTEGVANLNAINGNIMDGSAAFDAIAQEQSESASAAASVTEKTFKINTSDDEDGLITQAILLGNIEAAVSLCFASKRYADAVILSMAAGPDLLARTQYRYFSEHSGALNSLINSLVSENWADVVKNSDISCWKEVLVGIFTHSNAQERSSLCDMLGDRLQVSEDSGLQKEAQICYICSGNLNKMIESSEIEIQEVVEIIVIMQKALELQGIRELHLEGKVINVLTQYAEMLAAEGDLEAALNYLGKNQDPKVVALKERLCRAVGYIQESQPATRTQNYYEPTRRNTLQESTYPSTLQQTTAAHNWNVAPTKQPFAPSSNQFNVLPASQPFGMPPSGAPHPPSSHFEQYQPSPTQVYNPIQQAAVQPAPPPLATATSLTGSRPPSVGPQSRSKYLVDPSVKSSSSYGSSTFGSHASPYGGPQVPTMPSFAPQTPYQPQGQMGVSTFPGQPQSYMPAPKEPEVFKPMQPSAVPPPSNLSQSQMFEPVRNQPMPQNQNYGNEGPYQPVPQAPGWNDPPIGRSSRAQSKPDYQPQSPIMHPLRAATQADPNMPQEAYNSEPQVHYNPQYYGQGIPAPVNQYAKPMEARVQSATIARAPEPEKPKAPIPEQHIHLKTVLDELKTQCHEHAKNPQIKRKIEDVSRKLEVLYDCLRENKLSPNTLQGLHQISQMIQNGNYTGGLDLHTQLVSGPDFSQISSFMPGIKVLLLSALQMSIYIR